MPNKFLKCIKPTGFQLALVGTMVLVIAVVLFPPGSRRAQRLSFWIKNPLERGAIVFLGDSIIAGWPNLAAAFPQWKVTNRGLGGDRTVEVLRRLERDVLPLAPRAVVLLVGTNDLNTGADPQTVLANVERIVLQLRARFPELPVVVCQLTPRELSPGRFPDQILQLNAALKAAFGHLPHTLVFDTWSLFANEAGAARRTEFPDLLHPTPEAYAKWGAALAPVLQDLLLAHAPSRTE